MIRMNILKKYKTNPKRRPNEYFKKIHNKKIFKIMRNQ